MCDSRLENSNDSKFIKAKQMKIGQLAEIVGGDYSGDILARIHLGVICIYPHPDNSSVPFFTIWSNSVPSLDVRILSPGEKIILSNES